MKPVLKIIPERPDESSSCSQIGEALSISLNSTKCNLKSRQIPILSSQSSRKFDQYKGFRHRDFADNGIV